MTFTATGLKKDVCEYVFLQSIEPDQHSEVDLEWKKCRDFLDAIEKTKKEPMYKAKTEKDYSKNCDMCDKGHIFMKTQEMQTSFFFKVEKITKYCDKCSAIKQQYLIAFNNIFCSCYKVTLV
jgi:hypothetical protein